MYMLKPICHCNTKPAVAKDTYFPYAKKGCTHKETNIDFRKLFIEQTKILSFDLYSQPQLKGEQVLNDTKF